MKTTRFLLIASVLLLFLSARKQQPVYDLRYVEENMRYIPMGSFIDGPLDETPDKSKVVSVDSFYLFRYEIPNALYRYYLTQLQKSGATSAWTKALPDTLVWRDKLAYNEPYVDYYFRHPAYASYPLVGVSYEQALDFCAWLTTAYNAWPERKYKKVQFDLPSKNEWMEAAYGGNSNRLFPWEGYDAMNKDHVWLANFRKVKQANVWRDTICNGETVYLAAPGGDDMGIPGTLNDAADITAPVTAYFPNEFGIYNMAGNVEEMVKEKGITKGGSWRDPGYYLTNHAQESYTGDTTASSERGFRITMKIVQEK